MDIQESAEQIDQSALRENQANEMPFILRAWWLRNFLEAEGLVWAPDLGVTSPLWSLYSDPMCDVGSLDQYL
jgi:hypothetical protein